MSVYDERLKTRTVLVRPFFAGKTYLMLKSLSRTLNRDFYIITKSPPEQFSKSKIKISETNEEIKPLHERENANLVLTDVLGTSNIKYI